MYKSFILPLFDYADIVWDGCTEELTERLENLNLELEAIRIIIGGVCGTSRQTLQKIWFLQFKGKAERKN